MKLFNKIAFCIGLGMAGLGVERFVAAVRHKGEYKTLIEKKAPPRIVQEKVDDFFLAGGASVFLTVPGLAIAFAARTGLKNLPTPDEAPSNFTFPNF